MIRNFVGTDAEACSKILAECVDKQVELRDDAKTHIKENATPQDFMERSKKMLIVVYEENESILGMGALDKNEIRTMFTKITSQGKGIGSKILNYLESEAIKKGFDKVFLHSALNSVNFYKKKGYSYVRKLSEKKGGIILENVLMEKKLI